LKEFGAKTLSYNLLWFFFGRCPPLTFSTGEKSSIKILEFLWGVKFSKKKPSIYMGGKIYKKKTQNLYGG